MSKTVLIELPADAKVPAGYVQQHLNLALTPAQGKSLKSLVAALDEGHKRLANRKPVTDGASAVRYLLEQYGVATDGEC